MLNVIMTSSVN